MIRWPVSLPIIMYFTGDGLGDILALDSWIFNDQLRSPLFLCAQSFTFSVMLKSFSTLKFNKEFDNLIQREGEGKKYRENCDDTVTQFIIVFFAHGQECKF